MDVEITWENGDETTIENILETDGFVINARDGTIFQTIQVLSKQGVCLNLCKARMIKIIRDD